ncbi:MAG: type III pantothenate kinase [Bacteroidales bacterium]|nr:type III pantothenate kinase [Bacteroidales bacterium]
MCRSTGCKPDHSLRSSDPLLAVEVGNTTVGLALLQYGEVLHSAHVPSSRSASQEDFASNITDACRAWQTGLDRVQSVVLSSVVPEVEPLVQQAVQSLCGVPVRVVSHDDIARRMPIRVPEPARVGRDRLLDCLGALTLCPAPLIVIDMGTATTVNVVDGSGSFVGGLILPGVRTALDALSARASLLPEVEIVAPPHLIGQNPVECMQSGAVYGTAAMIDGLIARIAEQAARDVNQMDGEQFSSSSPAFSLSSLLSSSLSSSSSSFSVLATGGWASTIVPHCRQSIRYVEHLQMLGLAALAL